MNKKKTIIAAIILALILVIGGILAVFTDTDTETNVFTIGDVDIEINETFTPADAQDLMPNEAVSKTPTVSNESDSNPAYVFADVVIPMYDSDTTDAVAFDTPLYTLSGKDSGWTLIDTLTDATNGRITYRYAWGTSSAMTELAASGETAALFTTVTVANIDGSEPRATNTDVVINAYGIQTEGITGTPSSIFTANFGS